MAMPNKFKVGDRIGHLQVIGSRKELMKDGKSVFFWLTKCVCGFENEMRTNCLRKKMDKGNASCGCQRRTGRKAALARAHINIEELDSRDPSRLEIAERCLDIHNDAGRQAPIRLMEILKELR